MTILDDVIAGATDDSVSTSNLLRKLLVVGKRLDSEELVTWAKSEMNGYERHLNVLPAYRGPIEVPVRVTFSGPMGSMVRHSVSQESVPDEPSGFRKGNFNVALSQPLAELEALAGGEDDATSTWSSSAIGQFQKWGAEERAPHVYLHGVYVVEKIIPRSLLRGVVDTVRDSALDLALGLQCELPDAGEVNGPTTHDPKVRTIVTNNYHTHIHGDSNTVGVGESVTQYVTVTQGDATGLLSELNSLGLADADRQILEEAIEEDSQNGIDAPGNAIWAFLGKLGAGVVKLGGEVAKPAAIASAKAAIGSYLGVEIL